VAAVSRHKRRTVHLLAAGVGAGTLLSICIPAGALADTTNSVPSQATINATQDQVNSLESTIQQEQQKSAALSQQFDAAIQAQQDAQAAVASLTVSLNNTKTLVATDKANVAQDAVNAYVFLTPVTGATSLFATGAAVSDATQVYQQTVVGNIESAVSALQTQEAKLATEESQQQAQLAAASSAAAQAQTLEQQNNAASAATQATLSQVKGTLATEVAAAAQAAAQAAAAQAAAAKSAQQAQQAATAAAGAAAVATAVGGSSAGAAATTTANQGGGGAAPSGGGGSSSGGQAAVNAALSQLGVPYVFGGETPGQGFDCSGLTQWAWAQAGVGIPRTAASQWEALPHVSLNALQPGDLLFYYNLDADNEVDHVVMYVGSGPYGSQTIVQAPRTGTLVSYSPIFTLGLIGAARP
jgi:peptidoglycan DL-endopeptidase CwlO